MFEMEGIFTKDELIAIRSLLEDCERLSNESRLEEVLEYLEIMVDNIAGTVKEVETKLNNIAVIKKHRLANPSVFSR